MDKRPDLLDEEREFLSTSSPDHLQVFEAMGSILGLDYFGVDYALDEGGAVVVFEINCCFRPVNTHVDLPLHAAPIARIKAALAELIHTRAATRPPLEE